MTWQQDITVKRNMIWICSIYFLLVNLSATSTPMIVSHKFSPTRDNKLHASCIDSPDSATGQEAIQNPPVARMNTRMFGLPPCSPHEYTNVGKRVCVAVVADVADFCCYTKTARNAHGYLDINY